MWIHRVPDNDRPNDLSLAKVTISRRSIVPPLCCSPAKESTTTKFGRIGLLANSTATVLDVESTTCFPDSVVTFQTNVVREWSRCWRPDWRSTDSRNQEGDRSVSGRASPTAESRLIGHLYLFFLRFLIHIPSHPNERFRTCCDVTFSNEIPMFAFFLFHLDGEILFAVLRFCRRARMDAMHVLHLQIFDNANNFHVKEQSCIVGSIKRS